MASVLSRAVVHQVNCFLRRRFGKNRRRERAFQRKRAALSPGLLRLEHNFQNVQSVVRIESRRRAGIKSFNKLTDAVGP